MAQGAFTPAFANLSAAFRLAFPSQHWNNFSSFGVHSDVMLSLAAGTRALGDFMRGPAPQPQAQFAQDCSGMMGEVFQRASLDPFEGLGNQVPFDALMTLSNHLHEWAPPDRLLNRDILRMCEQRIRQTRDSMDSLLQSGSPEQQRIILNLGNVATLADHLTRLSAQGVTARPEFRAAFSHMPALDDLPQWGDFRAESLSRFQPPPAEERGQTSEHSEVCQAL